MSDKKRKIYLFIVCIIAGFIATRIVSNSSVYLERKIERTKDKITKNIVDDYTVWQKFAETALDETNDLAYRLYRDSHRSNFTQELENQIDELLSHSSVEFDEVYTVNQTYPMQGYPESCCVFRDTIRFNQGVYAWVDLLYVPSADLQDPQWYKQYFRQPENIVGDWYIIVFYGY